MQLPDPGQTSSLVASLPKLLHGNVYRRFELDGGCTNRVLQKFACSKMSTEGYEDQLND